jgi:hypothetical protein
VGRLRFGVANDHKAHRGRVQIRKRKDDAGDDGDGGATDARFFKRARREPDDFAAVADC